VAVSKQVILIRVGTKGGNLHFREYIEETIILRLTNTRPNDSPVDYLVYCSLLGELRPTIRKILDDRRVIGFTRDDLESFFNLKVYQILSRSQYDFKRSPRSFFKTVFTRFLNDIDRMRESCFKKGMDIDALDNCKHFTIIDEKTKAKRIED